jgi:DNA topoisomerase I
VRLHRSDCSSPGIQRRRFGRGFAYYDADGAKVEDPEVLGRIRALAIPPAWTDVWICPRPGGHIQAIGTDARGRRQYRYHDAWRERRDQEKFDRMLVFAHALPDLRADCADALATDGMSRDRVLACAVRLLDLGFFRIGTEEYAEENHTYGLATMRKKQVHIHGSEVTFDYAAKGGKRRMQSVVDPEVADVVSALKRRRSGGPELLAYQSGGRGGRWRDVKSADINAFIKEHTGEDFSAKDFRTWSATVLAAMGLAVSVEASSATARKRAVRRAVQEVADYLGNTPAVCRSSYIDPRLIDRYLAGETIAPTLPRLVRAPADQSSIQRQVERAVCHLLNETARAA